MDTGEGRWGTVEREAISRGCMCKPATPAEENTAGCSTAQDGSGEAIYDLAHGLDRHAMYRLASSSLLSFTAQRCPSPQRVDFPILPSYVILPVGRPEPPAKAGPRCWMSAAPSSSGAMEAPIKPSSSSQGRLNQSVVFGNQEMVMATSTL